MEQLDVGPCGVPTVSVLMPTYKHAEFLPRALASLCAQTFTDWELVVVDDGSPDATLETIAPYLGDPRVRYYRLERNGGLGAALNLATSLAAGRYLAYLPSDDAYYPDHLARLVDLLESRPDLDLAYGGVHWCHWAVSGAYTSYKGPLLRRDVRPGQEADALAAPPQVTQTATLPSGNVLALVQVMHKRGAPCFGPWPTREEIVSDSLEPDFWRAALAQGAKFGYAGAVTCEWVEHPNQRHKIIAGGTGGGRATGLSHYRRYYGIQPGERLNWRPSRWASVDERERYRGFAARRRPPARDGLRILLVGELGWNPERILAFEERGHQLFGLWISEPEMWDTVGPLPFGNVQDVPYDACWRDRVRDLQPDLIYGLLNWQSLQLLTEVLDARLGVPFVFHYKEGFSHAQRMGLWPALVRCLTESDGRVFISEESRAWYSAALDGRLDPATTHILDGDPPKIDWMTDDWSPLLSAADGEIHTVCTGRPLGLAPFDRIAAAGIHVHFYGQHFQQWFPDWTARALKTGYLHLHHTVEPAQWVRELSQYDAAWLHVCQSSNDGDIRRAEWSDLNLPARIGTYTAAGLPWIITDNRPSTVAVQNIALQHDIGVLFSDFEDLGRQLRDRARLAQVAANVRAVRHSLSFDGQVDELIAFFRRIIDQQRPARRPEFVGARVRRPPAADAGALLGAST